MSLTINRLILEANTADGLYGVDITLSEGLFILRVENTHGKSTCINAIAYALGMEMALGQKTSKPPFPPSLLKNIQDKHGTELLVISSNVKLEITNSSGTTVTLKRNILGADADTIITRYAGSIDEIEGPGKNLFLHREGDTSRELGFYHWVSSFLEWDIPLVPNNTGKESPLYPALLFPLFFVEQKKGWGSIQATTPFHFQITQAKKRAFEFIVGLDVNNIVKKKAKNKQLIDDINTQWVRLYTRLESMAIRLGGRINGVNELPRTKFESYKLDIIIESDQTWSSSVSALEGYRSQLLGHISSVSPENPSANQTEQTRKLMQAAISDLREGENDYDSLQDEIAFINSQVEATEIRLENLTDDKRKYEDLRKVKVFDTLNGVPLLDNECPTCGQEYSDHSANIDCTDDLMTLEESLNFIKSQISTFKSVLGSYKKQHKIKTIEANNLDKKIERYTFNITRLKEVLYREGESIDEEFLREKIRLESLINIYEESLISIADFRNEFDKIHATYIELVRIRKKFPDYGFSKMDNQKLSSLEKTVVKYLSEFGFSSFDAELMKISKDNYLPTREGFDLGFDTSASDGIRVIWSYLISLFSLRDNFSTNHPGVLIFDEPRQQEANKMSFAGLLKGASESAKSGQIIFATSEEEEILNNALEGCEYTLKSFSASEGKILRKLPIKIQLG